MAGLIEATVQTGFFYLGGCVECTKCEHMAEKCSIEEFCGIGQLKACPYINEPVLNEYGWVLNPPFTERYQLSGGHVFLIPERTNSGWKINWIITKNGAGSCGKTETNLFILSYKKAIEKIVKNDRINGINRMEIKEIFGHKFDKRRTFLKREFDHKIEEFKEEIKTEYDSPFEDIKHGKIVEQLDLFS